MDAANAVDWSMGSYAARLADWETAVDIGQRVSGPAFRFPASSARGSARTWPRSFPAPRV